MKRRLAEYDPPVWSGIFGNSNPVDIEIGIGNGSFMAPFCTAHPERNLIGVEIDGFYAKKADRKLIQSSPVNARLLIGDAKLLVWRLIGPKSIENIYINYPDPWFKRRRLKRRVVNAGSLRMLAEKMTGILTVVTDDPEYREWVLDAVRECACFETAFSDGFVTALDGYFSTKYEKKWKAQGKTCYYMKFKKTQHPVLDAEEYIATQNLRFPLNKLASELSRLAVAS